MNGDQKYIISIDQFNRIAIILRGMECEHLLNGAVLVELNQAENKGGKSDGINTMQRSTAEPERSDHHI